MKEYLNIKVPNGTKIAVVGDLHEQKDQFIKLIEKIQPSKNMILVSLGDLFDKGGGQKYAEFICDKIKSLNESGYAYVIRGNHELKHIKKAKRDKRITPQLSWLDSQPLALSFVFYNGTRLTAVHGGVKPNHTWDDLEQDIEVAYIRDLDPDGNMIKLKWSEEEGKRVLAPISTNGKSWHEFYDGRFGYIASGHNGQSDGIAKFYNYSCNLDSSCYLTGILSCQIFSENGLEELIIIDK